MNISALKQSNFLQKSDVIPPVLLTMKGISQKNVAKEGEAPEMKFVLHFEESEKPLVLNSTNGQIIADFTKCEDTDGWVGQKVVLYNDPNITFQGRLTGGIRARAPKTTAAAPASAAQPKPNALPAAPEQEDDCPY